VDSYKPSPHVPHTPALRCEADQQAWLLQRLHGRMNEFLQRLPRTDWAAGLSITAAAHTNLSLCGWRIRGFCRP